jgi:hypothetical protein
MTKKAMIAILITASVALLTGCTVASPDAGHEAVWVKKPVIFGHGGVDPTPVKTGREFGATTSDAIDVNMLPQRADLEFDDIMTRSGVPVSFHVVGTFRITDSVKLVEKFGADWDEKTGWGFWTRNLDQPIRTAVRDAVKKHDMQEMAISQTAADQVGSEVRDAAVKIVKDAGVPIIFTELNVGRVNPPDAIKNQRVETAAQEQRAITEQQRKLAEDQRLMAEQSRARADNAYRESMQLSPEQYLRLETIKMQHDVCGASGKATCTFLIGAGSAPPVYNIGK